MSATGRSKREYFDEIAPGWDAMVDAPAVRTRLQNVLDEVEISPAEAVLDLGCGTGILSSELCDRLGPGGSIIATDFSEEMILAAQKKINDGRVRWLKADAAALPLQDASVDRVICFSTWPHFPDPSAAAREVFRVLRPGGRFHILHVASRQTINAIHEGAGGPIARDLLPPAAEVSDLLLALGFRLERTEDSDDRFVVEVIRP